MSKTKRLLAFLFIFCGLSILTGCASVAHTNSAPVAAVQAFPVNLDGTWHQTSENALGITMVATVTKDKIVIAMTFGDNDDHGLYWQGTFQDNATSATIISQGDKMEMDDSLFGSEDSSKVFTYNNGDLAFPSSFEGVDSIIHLSKGDQ